MKLQRSGFVLPTVLITGTVLLFVLAFVLESISAGRSAMRSNYYQLLTRQAAESGIARAKACLIANERTITWTDEKPLRPNTDCRGEVLAGSGEEEQYLLRTATLRSFFEVKASYVDDDHRNVSAEGVLEVLHRDTNRVINSYRHNLAAFIKTDVTFSDVVFGSLYVGNGFNDLYSRNGQTAGFSKAVYFFTKTHLGKISSVGYNMDGVLTGYYDNNVIPWSQHLISDPKEYYHTPYALNMPHHQPIKKIITDFQGNGWFAFFLAADGRTIHGTGSNINCDLGLGFCDGSSGNSRWSRPTWRLGESKMDLSNVPSSEKVQNIYANSGAYLLTDAGKLYAGGTTNLPNPGFGAGVSGRVPKPVLVNGQNNFNVKKVQTFYTDSYYIGSNGSLAVAVMDDGTLYGWGLGNNQAVGGETRIPRLILRPSQIGNARLIDAVTDGGSIWALDNQGRVWSVGNNRYGQLGRGLFSERVSSFGQVTIPNGEKVLKITADAFSVLFLTEQGNVYGAGLNNVAQLGFPNNTEECLFSYNAGWTTQEYRTGCSRTPRRFQLPTANAAQDIFIVSPGIRRDSPGGANYEIEADNYRNGFVITTDGEVYGAGSNKHGQLGLGSTCQGDSGYDVTPSEYQTPQKMVLDYNQNESGVPGDEDKKARAKYVRSGLGTTIVITDHNHVFTVGNNSAGQLGSGDTRECHIPKRHRYTNVFQTWYF